MIIRRGYLASLEGHIQQLEQYLDLVDKFLEENIKKIEAEYERYESIDRESMSEADEDAFSDYYSDLFIEAEKTIPRFVRVGFIVTCYSFMEQEMFGFSGRLGMEPPKKWDYAHGLGKTIEHLEKTKVYKIDAKSLEELKYIIEIRNILVHYGMSLPLSVSNPEDKYPKVNFNDEDALPMYIKIDRRIDTKKLIKYMEDHKIVKNSGIPIYNTYFGILSPPNSVH